MALQVRHGLEGRDLPGFQLVQPPHSPDLIADRSFWLCPTPSWLIDITSSSHFLKGCIHRSMVGEPLGDALPLRTWRQLVNLWLLACTQAQDASWLGVV